MKLGSGARTWEWLYGLGLLPVVAQLATSHGEAVVPAAAAGLVTTLVLEGVRRKLEATEQELQAARRCSETDALTGVRNRESLDRQLGGALQGGQPVALVFFDLDGFKGVNDTLGHRAGDDLLVLVARVIHQALRSSDQLYRLGGDEFLVVLRGCDHTGALRFTDRVRQAVRTHPTVTRLPVPVDLSAGVAMARPGETPASVLARADAAMYRAKRAGKGQASCDHEAPTLPELRSPAIQAG